MICLSLGGMDGMMSVQDMQQLQTVRGGQFEPHVAADDGPTPPRCSHDGHV